MALCVPCEPRAHIVHNAAHGAQRLVKSQSETKIWTLSVCSSLSCLTSPHYGIRLHFRYYSRVLLQSEKGIAMHSLCETSCPLRTVHFLIPWYIDATEEVQTDRRKATHMSLWCNIHGWAKKKLGMGEHILNCLKFTSIRSMPYMFE